jgi:hypothetical protein
MDKNKELCELLGILPIKHCSQKEKFTHLICKYRISNICTRKEKGCNVDNYCKTKDENNYSTYKYPDFQAPENFVKLLESLTKVFTNFIINTDSEGNITTSWFHFGTQFEEEFLNISKNLSEAIVLTAIKSLHFGYLSDELKTQAQQVNWKY